MFIPTGPDADAIHGFVQEAHGAGLGGSQYGADRGGGGVAATLGDGVPVVRGDVDILGHTVREG